MWSPRGGRIASPSSMDQEPRSNGEEVPLFETSTGLHQPVSANSIACFPELISGNTRTAFEIKDAIENAPEILPRIGTVVSIAIEQATLRGEMDAEAARYWAAEMAEQSGHQIAEDFLRLETAQQSLDNLVSSFCCEPQSDDYRFRKRIFSYKGPAKDNLLHNDGFTVSIGLPALQKALGRSEEGTSIFKLTDFLLPFSTFADSSVSGLSPSGNTGPAVKLIRSASDVSRDTIDDSKSLLDALFTLGVTSPCGQVSTLETDVDESVHQARQITANNFSVSTELIQKIESLWSERFHPATVRVEPYNIELYDPWGMFSEPLDTPETGLVGTFFVGLSLDINLDHHLEVGKKGSNKRSPHKSQVTKWRSSNGSFCAFYSNVPHSVIPLRDASYDESDDESDESDDDSGSSPPCYDDPNADGSDSGDSGIASSTSSYRFARRCVTEFKREFGLPMRGTIAFKVFLKEPTQREAGLMSQISESLNTLQKPFGILLRQDYTTECHMGMLKGSDAVLFEALQSLQATKFLVIPVLTTLASCWSRQAESEEDECETHVYPFNEVMIQASLKNSDPSHQWPKHLRNIPFLTSGPWSTTWSHVQEGEEEYDDEHFPEEEHFVCISGAVIALAEE